MDGKHYGWHKHGRKDGLLLIHTSGLVVERSAQGWTVVENSLPAFQASEQSRGVPFHDLFARLRRLVKEAFEWREVSNLHGRSAMHRSQETEASEAQPCAPADCLRQPLS